MIMCFTVISFILLLKTTFLSLKNLCFSSIVSWLEFSFVFVSIESLVFGCLSARTIHKLYIPLHLIIKVLTNIPALWKFQRDNHTFFPTNTQSMDASRLSFCNKFLKIFPRYLWCVCSCVCKEQLSIIKNFNNSIHSLVEYLLFVFVVTFQLGLLIIH